MWLKVQIFPQTYLAAVVSVLDGNIYWKCSNVHRDLLGGSYYLTNGIVKSRCLGEIQPDILHVKPRIKVYSTWELINVLYHSPRGGPYLASFVCAILESGKVRNKIAFCFAFTFEQAPVLVVRLERGGEENCPNLLDFKNALKHFVRFVHREYSIMMTAMMNHRSLPVDDDDETGTESIIRTKKNKGAPSSSEEEILANNNNNNNSTTITEIDGPTTTTDEEPRTMSTHAVTKDYSEEKKSSGPLFDGLTNSIPWEDLSPEPTMKILYSIIRDSPSSSSSSSFSSAPTTTNKNTPDYSKIYSTGKKNINCSSLLRVELSEEEISSRFPDAILMKTKKGEMIYLPKKE